MDYPDENFLVKPREVRVNSVPVLVAVGGIFIEYDQTNNPVKVTLELLPDEVVFRRAEKYQDGLGAEKTSVAK